MKKALIIGVCWAACNLIGYHYFGTLGMLISNGLWFSALIGITIYRESKKR